MFRPARLALLALITVLLLAAALRIWGLLHDLPFSYFGDELHFMRRSMAMGTGDLNPHWFHKPAFLMYVLAFFYGLYYGVGALLGRFDSTAEFGAHFLFEPEPFLLIGRLVVVAFGVATVYLVYRIGRKVYGTPWAGIAGALAAAVLAPMVALLADDQERRAVRPPDGALGPRLSPYPGDAERLAPGGRHPPGRGGHGHALLRRRARAGLSGPGSAAGALAGSLLENGTGPLPPRRPPLPGGILPLLALQLPGPNLGARKHGVDQE